MTLKTIGKVFTVRCVASSFRAVSAGWYSFPDFLQHFYQALDHETRQSTKKILFQGLLSKLCTKMFVKKFALMVVVWIELKNLSEKLQNRNTTLPIAHTLLTS